MRLRPTLAKLALLTGTLLLCLVLVEAALRIVAPDSGSYFVWQPFLHRTFDPSPTAVHGVQGPSEFRINSRGLRGDEIGEDHDPVILAIGGSTTECLLVDQRRCWPYLLQQELASRLLGRKPWVGNAGRSGNSTREHRLQVDHLLEVLPETDLVIVMAGANDLGLRLQRDADYDSAFMDRPGAEAHLIPRAFAVYPTAYAPDLPFHKRLALYGRLRILKDMIAGWTGTGVRQDAAGESIARWRENRKNAVAIRESLPGLDSALAEFARNLEAIGAACKTRGATILFVSQPTIWRSDLPDESRALLWWGGIGAFQEEGARVEYYSVEAMAEGMARYNETMETVSRENGFRYLDLASLLPRSDEVFYDDMHFTDRGCAQVAHIIAERAAKDELLAAVPSGD